MAECLSDYSEVCENEITDAEVSRMAYQVPPDEIRRFAVEYLRIPKIDVDHAKAASQSNAYEVATGCFDIWRRRYCGLNMRGDLYKILSSASKEGFIPQTAFQFLKEDTLGLREFLMVPKKQVDDDEIIVSSNNAVLLRNSYDTDPFVILNDVANEISSNSMEEAAVNVFGFTRKEIRIQRRLAEHQAMFQLLCSWWRIQRGSDSVKRCKLLEKLTFAQEKGLLSKVAFNHFKVVLNNMVDCPNSANLSIPRDQEISGRSSTSSDSEGEATTLMPNSTEETFDQPSRLMLVVQWIRIQITSLFSLFCSRLCFQQVNII